jgi:hypothetical protein
VWWRSLGECVYGRCDGGIGSQFAIVNDEYVFIFCWHLLLSLCCFACKLVVGGVKAAVSSSSAGSSFVFPGCWFFKQSGMNENIEYSLSDFVEYHLGMSIARLPRDA